jgi:hypothetical protein
MSLEAFASRLDTERIGVMGESIFIHYMPTDAVGILLRDGFGGLEIDHALPGYYKGSFMLIARDKTFISARDKLQDAIDALTMNDETIVAKPKVGNLPGNPEVRVNYIRPRHKPFGYPMSVGSNIEFVCNMDVCFVSA